MISIEVVTAFLGWCTVINIVIILLAGVAIATMHDFIGELAGKISGISREEAKIVMFDMVQKYRVAVLFFNLVPYIALKIVTAT